MNKITNSLIAGLAATVVLSILMIMKGMMGLMPDLDIINMLAEPMGGSAVIGWVAHFMIGVVGYGIAYVLAFSKLPIGGDVQRGLALGVVGWVIMMVMLLPMMGDGLFGLQMPSGIMVPIATLMLHVIFGLVFGFVFSQLRQRSTQ